MSIRATHRSICPDCESPVRPGDEIEMTADLDWVHVECPDELAVPSSGPLVVCSSCHLMHAGDCW